MRLTAPTVVDIYLTPECNLTCKKCYAFDLMPRRARMPTEGFLDLLDELRALKVFCIVFLGGEPMLAPDFFAISRHAIDLGFYTSLSTNGILLTQGNVEQMKRIGYHRIQVSMDGYEKSTVEFFKGPGTFLPTINGIKRAAKAGLHVHVGFVITSKNLGEIEKFLALITSLGAKSCHFMSIMPFGRAERNFSRFDLSPVEWKYVIGKLERLQSRYQDKIEIEFERRFEFESKLLFIPRSRIFELDAFTMSCEAARYEATVLPNGDVVPCIFFAKCEWIGGNVRKKTFKEIWDDSPSFREFREFSVDRLRAKCLSCKARHICRGGCRAVAYHLRGDFYAPDPRCPHTPESSPTLFTR